MTSVVLVDWLGRGGIAQTSESWAIELERAGHDVRVVTRSDRELGAGEVASVGPAERGGAIRSHLALCRFAARTIREVRPDVVVIQNYVIPALEEQVHRAARQVGARVVFVVHDHRHREWREGAHLGLARQLDRADRIVVHSAAVGEGLAGRPVEQVVLPVQLGLAERTGTSALEPVPGRLLAVQIGILNRAYKGADIGAAVAAAGVDGWAFGFAGVGAPPCPGGQSVDRFLEPDELVATVQEADAVLLPYRHATQSGVVVLAQLCGTVPVASAVDGVAEQIVDGTTGLLVPAGAPVEAWRERLAELADDELRHRLQVEGRAAVWRQHEAFRASVLALIAGT